ncbi:MULTISPECIES: HDOD domain-containing protein [Undibacterium]|uniref:HDOD domain-containing protein n=1 Tax=Undibacterium parvum TaxID=401471 RepID=A0A3Q9BQ19_9BURK|nr:MULTISPECIES: HDOD domain-containing protein [Undibacterium]AZP11842.1 HDOD domain-containing protein [Undibacterium parvum]
MSTHSSEYFGSPGQELPRDRLLKKIKEDETLPTLGISIAKVLEITSSGEDPVSKLAHFVLADVALTQKILRLSNTLQYRSHAGGPVTTVSRAIFLLGFNAVKTSALAMLLVDGFSNKNQARSVRKELVHSLCASIVARELAQRSKFADAEEAAVAALFKNIGKVLLASFDHQLHERIHLMETSAIDQASDAANFLLGCSYARLGEAVLQEWKIPDTIIQSLGPLPNGEVKKAQHRSDWLKQVASFSDAVAGIMFAPGAQASSQSLAARCSTLLPRFSKALELDKSHFEQMLDRVEIETRELAESMGIGLLQNAQVGAVDLSEEADASGLLDSEFMLSTFDSAALQVAPRHPSGKPSNARDLLLAGVQDVMQMMASDQVKLNDMILLVLETLYSAMGFRFATACLRDMKQGAYVARVSVGELYAERQRRFVFPVKEEKDVFHLAMSNNVDLMISDAAVAKIQNLLPQWHKDLLPDTRSFIILPLVLQKKAIGFFYADRALTAEEGVPADETALIKTLKSQLIAAMMRG